MSVPHARFAPVKREGAQVAPLNVKGCSAAKHRGTETARRRPIRVQIRVRNWREDEQEGRNHNNVVAIR
jgi:hypothetical protein